jgi:hypothetical protein
MQENGTEYARSCNARIEWAILDGRAGVNSRRLRLKSLKEQLNSLIGATKVTTGTLAVIVQHNRQWG